MTTHFFGCIPDDPDDRDYLLSQTMSFWPFNKVQATFPASVDLRPQDTPVRNQLNLGACTGFALSGEYEFLHKKVTGEPTTFSPLFVYYKEREVEGTITVDKGAMLRDGMKVLVNTGICSEGLDPYDPARFATAPTQAMLDEAAEHKVTSYHRVISLQDYKAALASGCCVALGFVVYESFLSQWSSTGHMPLPRRGEKPLGGHAVRGVGYQDDASTPGGGFVILKNQWSSDWGDHGYFYMPYACFRNKHMVGDMWVALK